MSMFADWFQRRFLAAEHAAENIVHQAEKELDMISQAFTDAIARIKAALASHTDDAKTISDLQGQLSDLQTKCAGHEATIADLTQKLSDATSQIADMEQAAIDAAPPAAV